MLCIKYFDAAVSMFNVCFHNGLAGCLNFKKSVHYDHKSSLSRASSSHLQVKQNIVSPQ